MKKSLTSKDFQNIGSSLKKANREFAKHYPGELSSRQPVHTVYGGAQIFSHQVSTKMSEAAIKHLKQYASGGEQLALALQIQNPNLNLWNSVYERVMKKLSTEAVEDFRIDFEDGYGNRPDSEEDGDALKSALEVAKGLQQKTLPPFLGIRLKPFNEERVDRAFRTLDIFITNLLNECGKENKSSLLKTFFSESFVITLPKVQIVEQAKAFEKTLSLLEKKNKLKNGTLQCELMIETPQAIIGRNGVSPIRAFVDAMKGRCRGVHFGTYDYTAGCNVTAACQTMANPVCDFAKHVMQVSLAGTPVMLSDGATNIFPITTPSGENRENIYRAWRISYNHIRHSLETGYYQGWDLHPAQLPIRYIAVYSFFLESYQQAANRLKSFVEKAAKATLVGDVFDDAATGQGLLNYFLRGMSSAALTQAEALSTGLSLEDFQSRSFIKILNRRS